MADLAIEIESRRKEVLGIAKLTAGRKRRKEEKEADSSTGKKVGRPVAKRAKVAK
jgi:hypothetical protein